MIRKLQLMVPLVLTLSLGIGLATGVSAQIPFDDAHLFVQINATDGDASLQLALDGEAWKSLKLFAPGGRKILNVKNKGRLKSLGLTGLTLETDAPGFDEFPLEEFRAKFPEGQYIFRGMSVDGERLVGTTTLTHEFPAGPIVVAPGEDAIVSPDSVVVSWNPVTEPPGIIIVAYQVVVTRNDPHRQVSIDLPADVTSVTIPAGLLEPSTEYALEVTAQETGGNQTTTEILFRTS